MWRGTLIITAGILLNIVVCGALFRPLPEPQRLAAGGGGNGAAGMSSESDVNGGSQRGRRRRRPSAADSDEPSVSLSRASPARLVDAETEGKGEEGGKMDGTVTDGNLPVTADKATLVWMSPLGGRNVSIHGTPTDGSLNGNCPHQKTTRDAMNAYSISSPKVASSPDVCIRPQSATRIVR
jgi:hypothetical protein